MPASVASTQAQGEPLWLDASLTLGWFPIAHRLPTEQQTNTPVPVYFEPPAGLEVKTATVRYKAFGSVNYKKADMKRMGAGFGYEIPCFEVTVTGDLKYFFELVGGDGGPLESIGSKIAPFRVHIKNDIEGAPPFLPGQKPPRRCLSGCGGFPPEAPGDRG